MKKNSQVCVKNELCGIFNSKLFKLNFSLDKLFISNGTLQSYPRCGYSSFGSWAQFSVKNEMDDPQRVPLSALFGPFQGASPSSFEYFRPALYFLKNPQFDVVFSLH